MRAASLTATIGARITPGGDTVMRELLPDLDRWLLERDEPVALATVVSVFRSAPRPEGAKLAISSRGELAGSVSGGCVEAGVAEAAQPVLATGAPALVRFGIGDDTAWDAGLTCGGAIEIFVERLEAPLYRQLRQLVVEEQPLVVATVVDSSAGSGEARAGREVPPAGARLLIVEQSVLGEPAALGPDLAAQVVEDARTLLRRGHATLSEAHSYEVAGQPAP